MLQLFILVGIILFAIDIANAVNRHRALFEEFNQSTRVQWFIWLFLVPARISFSSDPLIVKVGVPVSALFFIPAMIAANNNRLAFERAGTDRVAQIQSSVTNVVFVAGAGIALTLALWVWLAIFRSSASTPS